MSKKQGQNIKYNMHAPCYYRYLEIESGDSEYMIWFKRRISGAPMTGHVHHLYIEVRGRVVKVLDPRSRGQGVI